MHLKVECSPGRPGCILKGKVVFAKNAELVSENVEQKIGSFEASSLGKRKGKSLWGNGE